MSNSIRWVTPGPRPPLYPSVRGIKAPVPRLKVALLHPPRLMRIASLVWRVTMIFSFTLANSVVRLVMAFVSCAMAAWLLAMDVTRFAIASKVYR